MHILLPFVFVSVCFFVRKKRPQKCLMDLDPIWCAHHLDLIPWKDPQLLLFSFTVEHLRAKSPK
jgi:hypothetical protein